MRNKSVLIGTKLNGYMPGVFNTRPITVTETSAMYECLFSLIDYRSKVKRDRKRKQSRSNDFMYVAITILLFLDFLINIFGSSTT